MPHMKLLSVTLVGVLLGLVSCSSKPVTEDSSSGDSGGAASVATTPGACSAALRQQLSLVDEVSTAAVTTLSGDASDRTLYIDASVGGLNGQDTHPWIYIALSS